MTKIILNDLSTISGNEQSAINLINGNNLTIETASDNTLSRDGTSPNQMLSSLDMNSFRILNCVDAINLNEPATYNQVLNLFNAVAQGGVGGNVFGPASATNNNLVLFNGTTGKIIKETTNWNVNTLGTLVGAKNNSAFALTLTHPDSTDVLYDSTPIAALYIARPPTPTTRNFVDGIFLETDGASQDKGRGIHLLNYGKSDTIYAELRGNDSAGAAILLKTTALNATGVVIGTTEATQIGLSVRQEIAQTATAACSTLLALEANGAITEMMRINSTLASQFGLVFRMTGTGASPILIKNVSDITVFQINNAGAVQLGASGTAGSLIFGNATSGLITLQPVTGALGTVTVSLPAATDTLVGKATTDALTNKTYNGLTISTTTGTLTIASGKTVTVNNSITFAGTDSTTMTFPATSQTIPGAGQINTWTAQQIVSMTTGFIGTWQSTASGNKTITYKSLPTTGAAGDTIDWAFNMTNASGTEKQSALVRVSQDVATAGSEDISCTIYLSRAGSALTQHFAVGSGVQIGSPTGAFSGTGIINVASAMRVNNTQVVGARVTGYTAFTGTNTNRATAYDTATITLVQLAERVRALQVDLTAHGLIGA